MSAPPLTQQFLEESLRAYCASAAFWAPAGPAAIPEEELLLFLRRAQGRVDRSTKDELCQLFGPWSACMKRIGNNPLAMLSPICRVVVMSTLQMLQKAGTANLPPQSQLRSKCQDMQWCARMARRAQARVPPVRTCRRL